MMRYQLSLFFILLNVYLLAQDEKTEVQKLAETASNPVAPVGKLIFQNFTHTGSGNTWSNTLLVEPVIPLMINENIKVINYGIIPLETNYNGEAKISQTHLGNISYQGLMANRKPISLGENGHLTVAVGPSFVMGTSTNERHGTWNVGVALAAIYHHKSFMGLVNYSPSWGVGGSSIDQSMFQYIFNYTFKTGTSINTQPMMMKSEAFVGDTKWLIPVGGGVGQMLPFKSLPMNVSFNVYYNLVRPEIMQHQEWQFNVNIVCVLMGKNKY
ncbi:hypothetical protein [Flammeovirga agarivorans]|uniref:Neuromedin U n=1 Tax=Flammeovirga agarivorans TaxID=2726742 RepID=A0A7X8XYZ9_9BACT|nr:hypothetical protein [Flammeovirga agarivorans]NLR94699.1 hypothetical protein [Flammeovirga agarivorans]